MRTMAFLGEVAQPTAHVPTRNYAWRKEGSLSAKAKALASGPFRSAKPQDQRYWKGPFERDPEVAASIAQRPVTADDGSYAGDFTFGDRVSDDVFRETKKFIRKARHRQPVSPSKESLPAEAHDKTPVAQSPVDPAVASARRATLDQSQRPTVADIPLFEVAPDPPSAPCAYLGRHLRRNSPRKMAQQHGWDDEEEEELAPAGGANSLNLAVRRKKRPKKNIDVQARILTALVTGDQVSHRTLESEFRKAQANTATANPWALTVNQTGASMLGDTRGWTRPEPKPKPTLKPKPEPQEVSQAGKSSPQKRPYRRWFGYGPAPPVEPKPEPEPEPEFVPAGFDLHYTTSLLQTQRAPEPEPQPEPYKSPLLDLPTGSYWLDSYVPKAPPKCTCHPTKGSSGCRLHDPNYKHPAKEMETPPGWMLEGALSSRCRFRYQIVYADMVSLTSRFAGNTALNEEMAKIKEEYSMFVASGGVVKQSEQKRNVLLRSFLALRARLSVPA